MKVLLDTNVLLWWLLESSRLRPATRRLFADGANDLLWSAASTWEMAIKVQLGKLRLPGGDDHRETLAAFVSRTITAQGLTPLPVQHTHAACVATLPPLHRDPFDRLLVAQALVEQVPLLTGDSQLAAYGVECELA